MSPRRFLTCLLHETIYRPKLHPPQHTMTPANSISFAAEVSTPNGTLQRPRIRTKSLPNPTTISRSPVEPQSSETCTHPQRPGPLVRAKSTWSMLRLRRDSLKSSSPQELDQSQCRHDSTTGVVTIPGAPYSQEPRHAHKPNTQQEERHVYVLTLKTSANLADPINEIRRKWFPKELNRTPAHLTLFHALPHSRLDALEARLVAGVAHARPFRISAGRVFRMKRGVGIGLGEGLKEAQIVHDSLRKEWVDFLSEQDAGGWRPHWTVMNKVDDEGAVKEALEDVKTEVRREGVSGLALGLDLWRYDRGSWQWHAEFLFDGKLDMKCTLDMADRLESSASEGDESWERGSRRGGKRERGGRGEIRNRFGWRDRMSGFIR